MARTPDRSWSNRCPIAGWLLLAPLLAFAQQAPANVVQAQCFESAYHEIFNESPELAAPVFARLQQWLDQRFPVA